MKKLLAISAMLLCGTAFATVTRLSLIGPANVTVSEKGFPDNDDVTIAAGAAGVRNCLTHISAQSGGAAILRVLDGGTTVFAQDLIADQQFIDNRTSDTALCGTAATALRIKVTTSAAGAFKINYQGYLF